MRIRRKVTYTEGSKASPGASAYSPEYPCPPHLLASKETATNCHRCKAAFGMFKWKHRCKMCGKVHCSDCLPHQNPIEPYYSQSVKLCANCFMPSINFHTTYVRHKKAGMPIPGASAWAGEDAFEHPTTPLPAQQPVAQQQPKKKAAPPLSPPMPADVLGESLGFAGKWIDISDQLSLGLGLYGGGAPTSQSDINEELFADAVVISETLWHQNSAIGERGWHLSGEPVPKLLRRSIQYDSSREVKLIWAKDKDAILICDALPSLEVLDLYRCDDISDRFIEMIASRLRNLRSLDLTYCQGLSPHTLLLLGQLCANRLEELVIHSSGGVIELCDANAFAQNDYMGDVFGQFTRLTKLVVNGFDISLDDQAVMYLTACRHSLTHLDLDYNEDLTDQIVGTIAACTNLQYLSVAHCEHLTDRFVEGLTPLRRLRHLDLSCLEQLSDRIAVPLQAIASGLQRVSFRSCVGLSDGLCSVFGGMVRVQRLDVAGCQLMSDANVLGNIPYIATTLRVDLPSNTTRYVDPGRRPAIPQARSGRTLTVSSTIVSMEKFV